MTGKPPKTNAPGVTPNSGYVTKEAAASSDDGSVSGASNLQLGNE